MRILTVFVAIILMAWPAYAETDTPPPNAPPQWFVDDIAFLTRDGGRWITDNSDYKSEQEQWDSYGVEWRAGPNGHSMSGRLFALKDGVESSADFWSFSQYWDPASQTAVIQQYGWGQVGAGTMWVADGALWMDQAFTTYDGKTDHRGHKALHPDADTHITTSFSISPKGEWTPSRTYTWIHQAPSET